MHETYLVRAVVKMVEKRAAAQNARRASRVKIRFNPLTSHSADPVRISFGLVKQDSPLVKDAALELNTVPRWTFRP